MLAPEPVRSVPAGTPILRAADEGPRRREPRGGTLTLFLTSSVAGQTVAPGSAVDWTISAQVSATGNSGLALLSTDLVQDAANPGLFDIPAATAIGPLMTAFDRPAGISNPGPTGSAFGGTQVGTSGAKNLVQIGGSQSTFGMPGVECGLETSVTTGVGQNGAVLIASGSFAAPQASGNYTFRLENAVATVLDNVSPPTPPAHWPVSAATVNLNGGSFSFAVQGVCRGDMNCSGEVNFKDINPFVVYLSNLSAWQASFAGCSPANGDINADGTYPSFKDINPFVVLLSSTALPIPCP